MPIFERFNFGLVGAVAGLCGIAIALSPGAAAIPLKTGGEACIQTSAGGAPMAGCVPAAAPLADMAGVPMALPGPIPAAPPIPVVPAVPLAPPVPVVPAVPVVAVPAGAPYVEMAGGFGGKGDPIEPPRDGAPANGQPILPGPGA